MSGPDRRTIVLGRRLRPTGSGWVLLVLGALPLTGVLRVAAVGTPTTAGLIVALLVVASIGMISPIVIVRRVRIAVETPRDAVVDEPLDLEIRLGRIGGDAQLLVHGPAETWIRVHPDDRGRTTHRFGNRGIVEQITVEVRSTAPFGIFEARSLLSVPVRPVRVAPRPLRVGWRAGTITEEGRSPSPRSTRTGGEVTRTVREYVAGDPVRLVHWPTSARLGDLVVRELEPPEPFGQAIVLDLAGLGDRTETAVSYAMGACVAVLDGGGRVFLCTAERDGPVATEIASRLEAGRILAAAVEGPVGTPPSGWPIVEIGA